MSTHAAQPVLRTERFVLRPMAATDVEFVLRHFGDPLVAKYLVDSTPTSTLHDAQSIVDFYVREPSPLRMRWVVTTAEDGEPIGTCGFHLRSLAHHRAEVGYDLAPAWWGRGVMFEAMQATLRHGFEVLDLHRIAACIHPQNEASLRLAERLGFVREGIARDLFYDGAAFHDHWMLSLLAGERRS